MAPTRTFSESLAAAEGGDAQAAFSVGSAFLTGSDGAPTDPLRACKFLHMAMEAEVEGAADAFEKAMLMDAGDGPTVADTWDWLEAAQSSADANAALALAAVYRDGAGALPMDPEQAEVFLRLASKHGSGEASLLLGRAGLTPPPPGVPACNVSPTDSLAFFKRASVSLEPGIARAAAVDMAHLFSRGNPPTGPEGEELPPPEEGVDAVAELGRVPVDPLRAVQWARIAGELGAEQGVDLLRQCEEALGPDQAGLWRLAQTATGGGQTAADAAFELGVKYYFGRGVPKDMAEAVKWFRMAGSAGHVRACGQLGFIYASGKPGVPASDGEACAWMEQAAVLGDMNAAYNLGHMLSNGRGPNGVDGPGALKWLSKPAARGDAKSMNAIGRLYHAGIGMERDWVEAVKHYEAAVEAGHDTAAWNLKIMYEHGGHGLEADEALEGKWAHVAAKRGYSSAMTFMGAAFESGTHSFQRNARASRHWWLKGAEAGAPYCMMRAGLIYSIGDGGVWDGAAVRRWWLALQESGCDDSIALTYPALVHLHGYGGPTDDAQGFKLMSEAYERYGCIQSGSHAAVMMSEGRGAEADFDGAVAKAVEIMDRAAADEQDELLELHLLVGLAHWRGAGGKAVDEEAALECWRQAAAYGQTGAVLLIEEVTATRDSSPFDASAMLEAGEDANAETLFRLGLSHILGTDEGVEQSWPAAFQCMVRAADLGHPLAACAECWMREELHGGAVDAAEREADLIRSASEAGVPLGHLHYARLLGAGCGQQEPDLAQAMRLLALASEGGLEEAAVHKAHDMVAFSYGRESDLEALPEAMRQAVLKLLAKSTDE